MNDRKYIIAFDFVKPLKIEITVKVQSDTARVSQLTETLKDSTDDLQNAVQQNSVQDNQPIQPKKP